MLVPDYICSVVLHPLEDLGILPVFYPVDECFVPVWEVIEAIQRRTPVHAFLLVHYFGQPQEIESAKKFCHQNGLLFIVDNAHGYGSKLKGRLLESIGDMGFSSPRKQLQCPSGAVLYIKGKPLESMNYTLPVYPVLRSKEFFRRLIRPFPRIKAEIHKMLFPDPDYSDVSAFPEVRMNYFLADPYSVKRFLGLNWSKHAVFRREAWIIWSSFLSENGLRPVLMEPHPESCPWAMPVYAKTLSERLYWLRWGIKEGHGFFPWPTLPESILQSSPSLSDRWQYLFCLPLHKIPKNLPARL